MRSSGGRDSQYSTAGRVRRSSSNVVFLTEVGGGAFGNERAWIYHAMRRALAMVKDVNLDVRLVTFGPPSRQLEVLAAEWR